MKAKDFFISSFGDYPLHISFEAKEIDDELLADVDSLQG